MASRWRWSRCSLQDEDVEWGALEAVQFPCQVVAGAPLPVQVVAEGGKLRFVATADVVDVSDADLDAADPVSIDGLVQQYRQRTGGSG